jgi:hypothetical protein
VVFNNSTTSFIYKVDNTDQGRAVAQFVEALRHNMGVSGFDCR